MTIDPNADIPVTLSAAQWNVVLGALTETTVAPYRVIAPLLEAIHRQCIAVDPGEREPLHVAGEAAQQRTNGGMANATT